MYVIKKLIHLLLCKAEWLKPFRFAMGGYLCSKVSQAVSSGQETALQPQLRTSMALASQLQLLLYLHSSTRHLILDIISPPLRSLVCPINVKIAVF